MILTAPLSGGPSLEKPFDETLHETLLPSPANKVEFCVEPLGALGRGREQGRTRGERAQATHIMTPVEPHLVSTP